METVVQKMVLLDEVETSFLLSLIINELVDGKDFDILESIGDDRLAKLFDKIEEVDSKISDDKSQNDKVKILIQKLLFQLDII